MPPLTDEDYYRTGYWEAQLYRAADQGADKAVRQVFATLGVDVDNPQQIEALREDIRLARRLRTAFDRSIAWGLMTAVGIVALLVMAAVHNRWIDVIEKVPLNNG